MSGIRSVTCDETGLTLRDRTADRVLRAADLGAGQNTPARLETYIETVWGPANCPDSQVRCHVTSRDPLVWTVGIWDLGVEIPAQWWAD